MAWKLPRDGGGFNAGFDQSGGEQLWQAKTVSPTDPDVYQKGALWGSNLTHGGRNVNEAVEDYQDWSRKWGSEYKDENERLEKYKYKFGHDEDTIRRGFYRNYPSSYDLDFTIDDLNEQWYLPKEAPKDYEWLNQGGIASLENRPGYRWGGSSKEDPVHGYVWGGGGGPHGSYMTNRDITGGNLEGVDMYGQTMRLGRGISPAALARGYVDVSDRPRDIDPGMGVWPVTPGFNKERILPEWLKRESKILEEDEENLAGGGIASTRPGYKWGGSPTGKGGWSQKRVTNIPGTDKNIVRHLEKKKWGNFFDKPRHEKFARSFVPQDAGPFKSGAYEFYQSPLGTRAGMRVEPEWYHQRGHKIPENWKESYSPTIDQVSHLYEDEYEAGFPPDPNRPYVPSVLNPWQADKDFWKAEGGAVGLEPGIASLMGYAKGGMVTRVKVPKGQSKWMKRFMNNMRDS